MSKKLEEKNKGKESHIFEVENIKQKLDRIKAHYEKNKQDKRAMREIERIFAHLRKIKKYHGIND